VRYTVSTRITEKRKEKKKWGQSVLHGINFTKNSVYQAFAAKGQFTLSQGAAIRDGLPIVDKGDEACQWAIGKQAICWNMPSIKDAAECCHMQSYSCCLPLSKLGEETDW
jgi:hypothetical protein